jgi:ATP-binding cassette subfamily B protein
MGYVPQDNFLFSDTIINNIGFALDQPKEEDVVESAKLADVYDNIVEFKDGFMTMLGERGVTVSGGQKQRISIARALTKNPEILILDDSVSAVDTKTEEAIIKNLHRIRKGRTTIFIAHRISTVKRMDKIILLDHGQVVAIGNHKELMKTSPLYQDMVKRQTLENLVQGGAIHEGL